MDSISFIENLKLMKNLFILTKTICFALCTALLASCAVNPVTGKTQLMLMTEGQEIAMGAEYDPQLVASFGLYEDPEIISLIETKGTEMGKISHRPNLQYHFRILDSPVVNAFAVPGGYIYLTRGILAQLNNEAELMGVIGHEMGHVTARHSATQQSKSMIGQVILLGGSAVSERFAQFSNYAATGMELIFLSFSGENEREADALGIEYSTKLGYDANTMADFFDVLNKMGDGGSTIPTFLSTHPDPGDRNTAVAATASKWQSTVGNSSWLVNGDEYLRLIDGIVYGEDPRNGFVENNVFYCPNQAFKFTLPTGWAFENAASQISMAPEDGSAILAFMACPEKTLTEAQAAGITGLGLTNTQSKPVSINGLSALSLSGDQVTTDASTGTQSTNKIISYYIEHNGTIYAFHGLSTEANFTGFQPKFETTINSFAKLTDPSKLNVTPARISIKTVANTDKLTNVLTSMGVDPTDKAEIALLNNLELTDTVEKGKLLKIFIK